MKNEASTSIRSVIIALLFLFFTNNNADAQEKCAHFNDEAFSKTIIDNSTVPTFGEYRALVVYVKFAGDTSDSRDWDFDESNPPTFSQDVISSSSSPASYPSESISEYFYSQSDSQDPLKLYGYTYPSIVVTDSSEFHYYNRDENGVA